MASEMILPPFRRLPRRAEIEAQRERQAVIDAIDPDNCNDDELAQMRVLAALSDAIDETHRQMRRMIQ